MAKRLRDVVPAAKMSAPTEKKIEGYVGTRPVIMAIGNRRSAKFRTVKITTKPTPTPGGKELRDQAGKDQSWKIPFEEEKK